MNKLICNTLEANQNPKFYFKNSDQFVFYKKNKKYLNKIKKYNDFDSGSYTFDYICKNIAIYGAKNKILLDKILKEISKSTFLKSRFTEEQFINYFHSRIVDIKTFRFFESEIAIPFYSKELNDIYLKKNISFYNVDVDEYMNNKANYMVKMLKTYNFALLNSNFTKLVKIRETEDVLATYDLDCSTLYIVKNDGTLLYFLNFFDKWLPKVNTSHILNKLDTIVEDYINDDSQKLINDMLSFGLISNKMASMLEKNETK